VTATLSNQCVFSTALLDSLAGIEAEKMKVSGPQRVNPRVEYLFVSASSSGADLMSNKLKILLAEDEPSLSRYIETLLSQWDCDIVDRRVL